MNEKGQKRDEVCNTITFHFGDFLSIKKSYCTYNMTAMMQEEDQEVHGDSMIMEDENHDHNENERYEDEPMGLSSTTTTIDPSVVQSRIRQSASLQQEQKIQDPDQPVFPKLSAAQASGNKIEYRRVRCPPHRYTPLREHWEQILTPLVEYLKLQVRSRCF